MTCIVNYLPTITRMLELERENRVIDGSYIPGLVAVLRRGCH